MSSGEVSSFTVQVDELRSTATSDYPAMQHEFAAAAAVIGSTQDPITAARTDVAADLGRSFQIVADVLQGRLLSAGNAVAEIGVALGEVAELYARADGQQ